MKTLNELRKALKTINFTVKTKKWSHGTHALYEALDGKKLTANVFSEYQYAMWEPLFAWKEEHQAELKILKENTAIIGLL